MQFPHLAGIIASTYCVPCLFSYSAELWEDIKKISKAPRYLSHLYKTCMKTGVKVAVSRTPPTPNALRLELLLRDSLGTFIPRTGASMD